MRSEKWLTAASEWGPVIEEIRGFAKQTAGFYHNPAQPADDRHFSREHIFSYIAILKKIKKMQKSRIGLLTLFCDRYILLFAVT